MNSELGGNYVPAPEGYPLWKQHDYTPITEEVREAGK